MPDTLLPSRDPMYRTSSLAVVRGSAPRSVARLERRALMRREGHSLAIVATGASDVDDPAFHWLGDLRRGRLQIWGALLRFIDTSVRRRVPKQFMDMLAPLIQSYVDDAYDASAPTPPSASVRVA